MNFKKIMSIAHPDSVEDDNLFYEAIKNSSEQYKKEIYDIYFGKIFHYRYNFQNKEYGNVMGVEASDKQVDNLFSIQDEFGIEISLTMNQMHIPIDIYVSENRKVLTAFLDFIQKYYDRGLRSCTICNNHLMASGILHKRFPEMKWKNTVNQQVSNAQQVIDYLELGYNIIQIDRSLNRNIGELKRIRKAIDDYKKKNPDKYVKTCMLISEACLPFCPFKREHDDMQIYYQDFNYWENFGFISCNRWRFSEYGKLPRTAVDCIWISSNAFKEYTDLVDLYKWSGRLSRAPKNMPKNATHKICYVTSTKGVKDTRDFSIGKEEGALAWAESWKEIIENNLEPISSWKNGYIFYTERELEKNWDSFKKWANDSIWTSKRGQELERKLKNCKSQCWDCHLCERAFGVPDIDSTVSLKRSVRTTSSG